MLDPEIIPASKRRIGAFAIDAGLVAVLSGLVARSRFHRFEITERTPGTNEPIWTAGQFDRLSDLAQGFNRSLEWGDTLFVIDGSGILVSLLVGLVLSVILFVALPANTGWSPGKRLFSLRVIDRQGGTPPLSAFALRTIVGVIDLLPFVVPGLLGFILASRDGEGRRLGDRLAGTVVVDARRPVRFVDASVLERRSSLHLDDDLAADDSMVDLGDRLGPAAGDPDSESPVAESPVAESPVAESPTAPEPEPEPEREADPWPAATGATTTSRSAAAYPPPSHRDPGAEPARSDWTATIAPAWDPPIAEPAPVWHPTELETAPAGARTETRTGTETSVAAAASETAWEDPGTPVWNEQWQAWLFWDASIERWLRHDDATGEWLPIG